MSGILDWLKIAGIITACVALIPVAYFAGTAYFVSKSLCKDMEQDDDCQE